MIIVIVRCVFALVAFVRVIWSCRKNNQTACMNLSKASPNNDSVHDFVNNIMVQKQRVP